MVLSALVRGELVKFYYMNGCNAAEALRIYRRQHNLRRGPCSVQAVRKLIKKFELTGCTCDSHRSGRPSIPVESAAEVHEAITANVIPVSARRASHILDIPKSTVLKILHSIFHMFPYRYHRVQRLLASDKSKRVDFANEFLIHHDTDKNWIHSIMWTDEAHFTLTGTVNSKNCVHWSDSNPHNLFPVPLHDQKVTVWCGFTSSFILGPYFYEELTPAGFKTCSVNGERYKHMLENFTIPMLQQRNQTNRIIWMQDGATPHVSYPVKLLLKKHFGDRIISRHFDFSWPPRSPDLTPADFWLWGYLKSKVYMENPKTLSDLKTAITREILNIPSTMLHSAVMSTVCLMQYVISCDGEHMEHF
jgi:hypothetical protein